MLKHQWRTIYQQDRELYLHFSVRSRVNSLSAIPVLCSVYSMQRSVRAERALTGLREATRRPVTFTERFWTNLNII